MKEKFIQISAVMDSMGYVTVYGLTDKGNVFKKPDAMVNNKAPEWQPLGS